MSETTTETLAAGRDTDRAVAEKVFGWTNIQFVSDYRGWYGDAPHDGFPYPLPHYSTDPAAAAQVREWINARMEASPLLYRHVVLPMIEEAAGVAKSTPMHTICTARDWLAKGKDTPAFWCRVALALAEQDGA